MSIDPTKVYLTIGKDYIASRFACMRCLEVFNDIEPREAHINDTLHANRMVERAKRFVNKVHGPQCLTNRIMPPTEKDYLDFGWGLSKEYVERRKAEDLAVEKKQNERMEELLHKYGEPNARATA